MARGAPPGGHPGCGRPKGSKDKPRRQLMEQGLALLEEHVSPLDIMKCAMLRRPLPNGELVDAEQLAAAVQLAPYVHPRLTAAAIQVSASAAPPPAMMSVSEIVALAKRPAAPPLIEAAVEVVVEVEAAE